MSGVFRKKPLNVQEVRVTTHTADAGKFPVALNDVFESQLVCRRANPAYLFNHSNAFKPPARAGSNGQRIKDASDRLFEA
jgi:hypothetical protein